MDFIRLIKLFHSIFRQVRVEEHFNAFWWSHGGLFFNFLGHRGSRGSSTPRRASTAAAGSKSQPTTPKTPRKLSMTAPVSQLNSTHSGNTARPASPHMRSASPGPSTRKLSLTVKNGVPQPGPSVSSPVISNKQPSFSTTGLNSSGKIQNVSQSGSISTSGGFPLGSFVKQSQMNLTRQLSSGSSSEPSGQQPMSPGTRRSESPVPATTGRLKSPSPAPSNQKSSSIARTQSVPATQRCSSPMKQITLSELR